MYNEGTKHMGGKCKAFKLSQMAPALHSFLWTLIFFLAFVMDALFFSLLSGVFLHYYIYLKNFVFLIFILLYIFTTFCLYYFGAVFLTFPSSLLFLYLVTLPPVLLASRLYWSGMITWPHCVFYFLLLHLTDCLSELSFYWVFISYSYI